jgi:hypothetical protein
MEHPCFFLLVLVAEAVQHTIVHFGTPACIVGFFNLVPQPACIVGFYMLSLICHLSDILNQRTGVVSPHWHDVSFLITSLITKFNKLETVVSSSSNKKSHMVAGDKEWKTVTSFLLPKLTISSIRSEIRDKGMPLGIMQSLPTSSKNNMHQQAGIPTTGCAKPDDTTSTDQPHHAASRSGVWALTIR